MFALDSQTHYRYKKHGSSFHTHMTARSDFQGIHFGKYPTLIKAPDAFRCTAEVLASCNSSPDCPHLLTDVSQSVSSQQSVSQSVSPLVSQQSASDRWIKEQIRRLSVIVQQIPSCFALKHSQKSNTSTAKSWLPLTSILKQPLLIHNNIVLS